MSEAVSQRGKEVIEIKVDKAAQLFHTLDPFPFRERDLDDDIEDFIIGWARELPTTHPIAILVHLPKAEADTRAGQTFTDALRVHFARKAENVARDLRELFRIGRYSLFVGVAVLSLCVAAGKLAVTTLGDTEFARILQEGLIILGWVANWRPIEIFLYDWLPLTRLRQLYRRLAIADVQVQTKEAPLHLEVS